jgi:L-threonylcarbamoyladenylate synthase
MTEFLYLDGLSASGTLKLAEVAMVRDLLRSGGTAILPTETGYMLAAVATDVDAVTRVFTAKGRPLSNPMHVACSSMAMVERIAELTPSAARLLGRLTPGPVTVVARKTPHLPDELVTLNDTVGIRVPDHPATLQIIDAVGEPLTATSLNESGGASCSPDRANLDRLDWSGHRTVHIVDAGAEVAYPAASTLVRVIDDEVTILRHGPVTDATIMDILAGSPHPAR